MVLKILKRLVLKYILALCVLGFCKLDTGEIVRNLKYGA